jgi:hypothetical protein
MLPKTPKLRLIRTAAPSKISHKRLKKCYRLCNFWSDGREKTGLFKKWVTLIARTIGEMPEAFLGG